MDQLMPRLRLRTGEQAFTLIELLVVLTIAGLLMTIAAPRMIGSIENARLHESADSIGIALKMSRSQAIRTLKPALLIGATDQRHYQALGYDHVLPANQKLSVEPRFRDMEDSDNTIAFFPDGTSNGGVINIINGKRGVQLNIDWLTGKVSINE